MDESCELVRYQLSAGGVAWTEGSPLARVRPAVAHFGDPIAELSAARDSAAVFDLSDRVQIELSGADARGFLHKFCTNDVRNLAPGEGREAFVTNVKGRILAHVFLFATHDCVWIDTAPLDEQVLLDHFDRYLFSEDVRLIGRTRELGELYVCGTECLTRLAAWGLPVEGLNDREQRQAVLAGISLTVRRCDFWSGPGVMLVAPRQQLVALWQQLVSVGIQPAGAWAFHALRIEAGFPWHGIDLSADNLAQEADRTPQAICFTKGCYLGQEPIARLDAMGHVNRRLTRLRVSTVSPIAADTPVLSLAGAPVGTVTSAIVMPGTDHSVALGMLKVSHARPGNVLCVRCGHDVLHDALVC